MSIIKSSLLFSAGTFLSRLSGLLRTTIVASVFGASPLLDAFLVAFRIPNLLREMLAEGALANSFTKVFSSKTTQDPQRAKQLFNRIFRIIFWFSVIFIALGVFFSPQLVKLMVSETKVSSDFFHNATGLTRVLIPFLSLMMFGSIFSGVLHYRGKFFLSAISSLGFNIGFILGALLLAPSMQSYAPAWVDESIANRSILGLAIGVLLGGLLQTFIYGIKLYKEFIKPAIKEVFNLQSLFNSDTREVFTLMLPASLAASTGIFNQVINTNFATGLESGTVSWLDYSFRILQLPIGIFGVSVGIAILPKLSSMVQNNNKNLDKGTSDFFSDALLLVFSLLAPCWVAIYYFHEDIIRLLFEYGRFSPKDVLKTSEILFYSSFGLVFYGLNKTMISYYYSTHRTTYALYAAIVCIFINYFSNSILAPSHQHIGLAITTAIVLFSNSALLFLGLVSNIQWDFAKMLKKTTKICGNILITFLCFYLIQMTLSQNHFHINLKIIAALKLFCAGLVILIIFYRSGFKELKNIRR